MRTKWTIYYSDNSTISDKDATPFSITHRADVQVIIQDSPDHGWVTVCGDHFYVWDNRGGGYKWWGVDRFGFDHYLLQSGAKCVLFGTSIDNDRFREIFERARKDLHFNLKGAYSRRERLP